jgi:hypothetical protein
MSKPACRWHCIQDAAQRDQVIVGDILDAFDFKQREYLVLFDTQYLLAGPRTASSC